MRRQPTLLRMQHRYRSFQIFVHISTGPTLHVLKDHLFQVRSRFDCHALILKAIRRARCPGLWISVNGVLLFDRYPFVRSHFLAGNVPSLAILPSEPTTHGRLSAFQLPPPVAESSEDHVFPSS